MSISSDNVDDDLLLQVFDDGRCVLPRLCVPLTNSTAIPTGIYLSAEEEMCERDEDSSCHVVHCSNVCRSRHSNFVAHLRQKIALYLKFPDLTSL